MTAHDRITDALTDHGSRVEQHHGYTMAQCPAHDDNNPSLSIRQIGERARIKCHAGCHDEDVLDALGLSVSDLFDNPRGTSYEYQDAHGNVTRTVTRTPEKKFRQAGDTKGTPTAYRLPQVQAAVADGREIFLVEGEDDVHAAEKAGGVATTFPGGTGMIGKADFTPLYGATIVAVIDRDEPGKKWARVVHDALHNRAEKLVFTQAREGKDLTDHVMAHYTLKQLDVVDPSTFLPEDTTPDGVDPRMYQQEYTRLYTRKKASEAVEQTLRAEAKAALDHTESESWTMTPLTEFTGTGSVSPNAWARTDGEHLLYRGKSHALIADGGTGKTLIALAIAKWFARSEDVLFIDYEDSGDTAAMRMDLLGATQEEKSRFMYVTGDGDLDAPGWKAVTQRHWGLVIIDSVDEAMVAVTGDTNSPNDNGTVKLWNQKFVRPFIERGATVVMIDHLSKGKETSRAHARGASAKKDILTGAQLFLEEISPLGAGRDGTLRARVEKDRPGGLKGFMDDASAVADINVRSSATEGVRVFVDPPKPPPSEDDRTDNIKRTLIRAVDSTPGQTADAYRSAVTGRGADKQEAWAALKAAGFLDDSERDGNRVVWRVTPAGRSAYLD